jgi:hypothetical protein
VAADSNLKVTTDLWRQLHLDGVAALVDAISDKKKGGVALADAF